jgi:hypothetical protein
MTEQPTSSGSPRRRRVLHLTDDELKGLQLSDDQLASANLAGHHHHDDSADEPQVLE